jgi:hypothetical protein
MRLIPSGVLGLLQGRKRQQKDNSVAVESGIKFHSSIRGRSLEMTDTALSWPFPASAH